MRRFVQALQGRLDIPSDFIELAKGEERFNEFMDGASQEEIEAFGEELIAFTRRIGMIPLDQGSPAWKIFPHRRG